MSGTVVAICGGIGGAKLALGLYRTLPPGRLTVIVNTGDDFEHLGLRISPDVDTVLYTLSDLADPERGWGRVGETWNFMSATAALGGDSWFQLGDQDLAMHVARTRALRAGVTLSAFVDDVARRLGIAARIVPMSDDDVRTMVETDEGTLPFQRYFVERRCAPMVRRLEFDGASRARPSAEASRVLGDPAVRAVVVCPSNPYLSIDPILAVPGLRAALARSEAPVIAVSPLIGGQAIKGPTAKIMAELSIPATASAIAAHYHGLIDALVVDVADARHVEALDLPVLVTPTLMTSVDDKVRLAREILRLADTLRSRTGVVAPGALTAGRSA